MRPEHVKLVDASADVRDGGEYKIVLRMPDDDLWTLQGTYREVRPPTRLALTWIWVEDDAKDEQHTLLTLEFAPDGRGTELTLRRELFLREESRASHETGWGQSWTNSPRNSRLNFLSSQPAAASVIIRYRSLML